MLGFEGGVPTKHLYFLIIWPVFFKTGKCGLPAFYLLLPQQDGVATSSPSIDPVAPQRTQPRGRSSGLGQLLRVSGFVRASWLQRPRPALRERPRRTYPARAGAPGVGTVSSTGSRQAVFPSRGTSVHTDSDGPRAPLTQAESQRPPGVKAAVRAALGPVPFMPSRFRTFPLHNPAFAPDTFYCPFFTVSLIYWLWFRAAEVKARILLMLKPIVYLFFLPLVKCVGILPVLWKLEQTVGNLYITILKYPRYIL